MQEALNRTQEYWTLTRYTVRMCQLNFDVFRGEFQKAVDGAEKTAEIFHEEGMKNIEGDALFQQGLIFKELRKNDKFNDQMHFLSENFSEPLSSGATAWLAYQKAQAGRKKEALQFLQLLERGTMNDQEKEAFIHLIKGALARTEKKFVEAIAHFKEANELVRYLVHPPPYVYHPVLSFVAMAEVYEQNNQLDSAIESWQEIIAQKIRAFLPSFSLGPSAWVKSHYHLGRLYQKKGDFELAIQLYQKFLELWKDADPGLPEVEDAKKRLAELKSQ